MMLVVDASVVVKWVLPEGISEVDTDHALTLLSRIRSSEVTLVQPPHWLAEVAGVLARLAPDSAETAVSLLYAMEIPTADGPEIYTRACSLAARLKRHVFDTLYHAVALETAARLITADDPYFRKARDLGQIERLSALGRV